MVSARRVITAGASRRYGRKSVPSRRYQGVFMSIASSAEGTVTEAISSSVTNDWSMRAAHEPPLHTFHFIPIDYHKHGFSAGGHTGPPLPSEPVVAPPTCCSPFLPPLDHP